MIRSSKPVELQILETQKILYPEDQLQCRICLQPMQEPQLLEICKCKGNSGAIHKPCLLQWIKKSNKFYRHRFQYFYNCEICKTQIKLENQFILTCTNRILDDDNFYTLTMFVVLFISVVVLSMSLLALFRQVLTAFAIVGLVIGVVAVVIDLMVYVACSFLKINVNIVDIIQQKCQNKEKNTNYKSVKKNNQVVQQHYFQKDKQKIQSSQIINENSQIIHENQLSVANLNELFAE